ncbi:universal stress protein Sll1388-like [Ruditapes philippinarum]|uniref:universal stress protein Sll1388-like n=1 Tax=Ruditapes philippinarum TaxID=129788 RepID=UPI00295BCD1D|nr:universal stress protein Sll1388-like [Ruditapes philippinarum]
MADAGNAKRKIVIAMDGSQISEDALRWYVRSMRQDGDYVTVVYTPEFKNLTHVSVIAADASLVQKIVDDEKKNTEALMEKVTGLLKTLEVNGEAKQSIGEPGEQIIEVANEVGANLIITGSRGLGTLRRTFLGSVSDYVVHHAHIPVLVYKPEHKH